jgi:hypothetical protein
MSCEIEDSYSDGELDKRDPSECDMEMVEEYNSDTVNFIVKSLKKYIDNIGVPFLTKSSLYLSLGGKDDISTSLYNILF